MQANGISDHARVRMQQRGIPTEVLDCLLSFGHAEHDHHGGLVVYFNKVAKHKLDRAGLRRPQIDKHLNAYAVIACDGTVTTVGHRYKRILRS